MNFGFRFWIKKIMNEKVFGGALCALLFALCFSASAQQPAKLHRVGYLQTEPSWTPPMTCSSGDSAILLTWKARTSSSNTDTRKENQNDFSNSRPRWYVAKLTS